MFSISSYLTYKLVLFVPELPALMPPAMLVMWMTALIMRSVSIILEIQFFMRAISIGHVVRRELVTSMNS